jgi:ribonuclease PH
MADEKTKVTLIQSADGQVRRARINGTEVAILHGGPTLIAGKMSVSLTLTDVEIDAEMDGDAIPQINGDVSVAGDLRPA